MSKKPHAYELESGVQYYTSGLTEESSDPTIIAVHGKIDALLEDRQYEEAQRIAELFGIGLKARMQAIAYWHGIGAINARRNADGERMIVETTHMRQALDAVGLPFRDPIEEYSEHCRSNGHAKMKPLYEGKK